MKYERSRADQKHINILPLARQFALTAVKLQSLAAKQVMSGTLLEHVVLSRVHAYIRPTVVTVTSSNTKGVEKSQLKKIPND